PRQARAAAALGAAPGAAGRASRVRPGHARAAAGVLGDSRHGARGADRAAADAIVRPRRRTVEKVLQPLAGRRRVSETFQEYSARLLALSAGQDSRAVLAGTPARIGALVAGLRLEDLTWTTVPSRWSIAQIV